MVGNLFRDLLPTSDRDVDVARFQFDQARAPANTFSSDKRCPRSAKSIKDDIASVAGVLGGVGSNGRQKKSVMFVAIGVLASIRLMAAARRPKPARVRSRPEK